MKQLLLFASFLWTLHLVQGSTWSFMFDLSHGSITNEGTDETVLTYFWGRLGARTDCPDPSQGSKVYYPPLEEVLCLEHVRTRTAELAEGKRYTQNVNLDSDVELVGVVMEITGDNAMYVDMADLKQDGSGIASWGANGGEGWCLSTDKNDASSWYDYLGTNTCSTFVYWDATNSAATKCAEDEVCAFEALLPAEDRWYHYGFKNPLQVSYNHQGVGLSLDDYLPDFGFRMNSEDDATTDWRPQGITGFDYGGTNFIVTCWYDRDSGIPKGTRILLHDVSSSSLEYRRILLVDENLAPLEGWKAGGMAFRDGHLHMVDDSKDIVNVFNILEDIEKVDSDAGNAYSYVIRRSYHYALPRPHGTDNGSFIAAAYDLGADWFLNGKFKKCDNSDIDFHVDEHLSDCAGSSEARIGFYKPSADGSTYDYLHCNGPFLADMQGAAYFEKDGHHIMVISSSWMGDRNSHLHAFVFNPNEECDGNRNWNNLAYATIQLMPGSEDLFAQEGGGLWTVTEFGDGPDCYDGKNHREVYEYSKTDLKNLAIGNTQYEFEVNIFHSEVSNEQTNSETCAFFFSQKGTRNSCPDGGSTIETASGSYCYEGETCRGSVTGNTGYSFPGTPDRPISTVVLRTYGGDAMFLDYARLVNDIATNELGRWGENEGSGWCISTDSEDWDSSWRDVVGVQDCFESVIFDLEEEAEGGGGSHWNCPSSVGHCSDQTLFDNLLA